MAKAPAANFEVLFKGPKIAPEVIPLSTLSRAFSAVQRLASGDAAPPEPEENEASGTEPNPVSLLSVRRGSASFTCAARNPRQAVANLRMVGTILEKPDQADQIAYAFNPLDDLSAIAKSLGCTIYLRGAGDPKDVLATIEPDTFASVARVLLLEGETTIVGNVKRVGGATQVKCALRVSFQDRLLFCRVANSDIVRRLGQCLYEDVAVTGSARWVRNSWHVVSFTIREMSQPKPGSLVEAFAALREAGGKGWDRIANPRKFLQKVTGE